VLAGKRIPAAMKTLANMKCRVWHRRPITSGQISDLRRQAKNKIISVVRRILKTGLHLSAACRAIVAVADVLADGPLACLPSQMKLCIPNTGKDA
jgi:hypothetical protein